MASTGDEHVKVAPVQETAETPSVSITQASPFDFAYSLQDNNGAVPEALIKAYGIDRIALQAKYGAFKPFVLATLCFWRGCSYEVRIYIESMWWDVSKGPNTWRWYGRIEQEDLEDFPPLLQLVRHEGMVLFEKNGANYIGLRAR